MPKSFVHTAGCEGEYTKQAKSDGGATIPEKDFKSLPLRSQLGYFI